MPFAYYDRLTRAQQRVYRRSDEITRIPLPGAPALGGLVEELGAALRLEGRSGVEAETRRLFAALTLDLAVPACAVQVLSARPHGRWGELQGLYTPGARGRSARVTLWMRTARHRRVVAFRTFLRTLLHELGHHLDYELLRLPDSFHTEGFYKREASLFHQLVGSQESPRAITGPMMGRDREA